MNWKFQRESHNRQDKVWKEPTGCVGGKESPGLWSYIITPDHQIRRVLNREVADRINRQGLMEAFEAEVRNWRFIVSGYKFIFSWSAKEFAEANDLSLPKARRTFDKIRAEAEDRLRIVKQRIRRAGFSKGYERDEAGNLVEVYSLSYQELANFLQKDEGA
jgi:hypothetical protein